MVTIVKGLDDLGVHRLPPLEQTIKERYNIDVNTKKPLDVQELSKRIGEKPSLLLCAMLSNQPKCSAFGVKCLVEVLAGIAGNHHISVGCLDYGPIQTRPFNFTLNSDGFLKEIFEPYNLELEERDHAYVGFCFTPEHRVSKWELRELSESNGTFELDLKIDLGIAVFYDCPDNNNEQQKRTSKFIPVSSVVVEFDGPAHLSDEQVRKDKLRDSMVQSTGSTVFRIQMPYQHQGKGSTELNRDSLAAMLEGQIQDIKNHFQNRLFDTINASYLLKSVFEKKVKKLASFNVT
ncbi:endonuclease domain-containing protein [Rheinheimera soli]|uniref:endonuclease domain-containing protein n=1 Tax=Rheinheimera soli TaxID=443616 RepID=UPI001E2B1998|nr:endonuclease domain-containing protein [Rheinheimera soli]